MKHSRLLKILTGSGLAILAILAIFVMVIRPSAQESNIIKGPDRIVDTSKLFSLQIPRGWYGQLGDHGINIQNYDPQKIVFEHGKPLNLPKDNVKMEIYLLELSNGQTFEQRIFVEKSRVTIQNEEEIYDFGIVQGITYSTEFSRVAAFLICDDKGIFVNILPKDSGAIEDALDILKTININSTGSNCYNHN